MPWLAPGFTPGGIFLLSGSPEAAPEIRSLTPSCLHNALQSLQIQFLTHIANCNINIAI